MLSFIFSPHHHYLFLVLFFFLALHPLNLLSSFTSPSSFSNTISFLLLLLFFLDISLSPPRHISILPFLHHSLSCSSPLLQYFFSSFISPFASLPLPYLTFTIFLVLFAKRLHLVAHHFHSFYSFFFFHISIIFSFSFFLSGIYLFTVSSSSIIPLKLFPPPSFTYSLSPSFSIFP